MQYVCIKVQTFNLLRRIMSGDSLASTFYWTNVYKSDDNGWENTDGLIAHDNKTISIDANKSHIQ